MIKRLNRDKYPGSQQMNIYATSKQMNIYATSKQRYKQAALQASSATSKQTRVSVVLEVLASLSFGKPGLNQASRAFLIGKYYFT